MKPLQLTLIAALAVLVAACGGGTGGTGINVGPANAVSIGVMTKGSVIVNGVEFSDNSAKITIDDNSNASAADLQSGMVVRVRGQVNSGGTTGTAQIVNVSTEVRGTVQTHDATVAPPTFTVAGQSVFVDDLTVLANFGASPTPAGAVGQLVDGTSVVEVHGLRDGSGTILATRVELVQAPVAGNDELRGTVSALGASTFTLQNGATNVTVNFSGTTTIVPSGTVLANNQVVEVHGTFSGATFTATLINIEDDAQFQPANGERFEVEGLVSGFTATPGSFFVAGTSVTTTSSTRFEGGVATDLSNDIQVEAEGTFNGTTLLATKIEFKRSVIRLQGATANATANSFDMLIANGTITVRIEVDSLTSGTIPTNGTACVQVRGQRKAPATPVVVTAGEIDSGCSNGNRNFIQAPVEAKNPETTITLLASPIDVSTPSDNPGFQGLTGPLSRTAFFNTITAAGVDASGIPQAGTLVKVTFDSGAGTVKEVEIEDD